MWQEADVQGYQKCGIHVLRVIRNVTWGVCGVIRNVTWGIYTVIRNVMRHLHRVIRNVQETCHRVIRIVTWDVCPGLSEMWHVHRVMRNVTLDMRTALPEMSHETCVKRYQKSLITMNNELYFQWLLYICIPSYRHNNISIYQATHTIPYPLLSQITKPILPHCTTQSLQ